MELATITRLHRGSGLVLLTYLGFHAWEHWPAREGRAAVLERLRHTTSLAAELTLLVTALGLYGWARALRARTAGDQLAPPFRRLEVVCALLALTFVSYHALGVWLPRFVAAPLEATLDALQAQAGTLAGVVAYVLGIASVCTYVGLQLFAAVRRRGKTARALAVALAVMLYLVFVNELSAYATGASLL